MSKSKRKSYAPANKPSKRYAGTEGTWCPSAYDAGGYCRGHKTRHLDNQSLNQLVRTKEKYQWKKEINYDLER